MGIKKNILITGINGFLGSHIAKRLSTHFNVLGLEYSTKNMSRLEGFSFKVYSVEEDNIEDIFKSNNINIIIHTATFYGRFNEDIDKIATTNLFMPFDILNISIKYKVDTFINTDTVLDRFASTYALTKKQFQEWLYFRRNEINVVNFQLEHFYGPGCSDSNFITLMIKRLSNNEPVIDLTKGDQKRDFIFYKDVVDAYELIIKNLDNLKNAYTNYEVCSGETITIKNILQKIKELTNSTSNLNFGAIPYRENELMESAGNNSDLISKGWRPKTSILEGLKTTIAEIDL